MTGYRLPEAVVSAGYTLVPATEERLNEVAHNMNGKDAAEIWAMAHLSAFEGLTQSAEHSTNADAVLSPQGVVLCAMGVATNSFVSSVGWPWFLGHRDVPKHAKALLRSSRAWVEQAKNEYDVLNNVVDSRYEEAVRWVKWLGFDVGPAEPLGPEGVLFHPFRWRK